MSVVFFHEKSEKQSWQISPFEATPERRYGDIEDQIHEGEGYISNWSSYKNLGRNMSLFDGIFRDKTTSTLNSNFLKYNIRKFVETLSDVREIGLYGSDAPQYKTYAEMMSKTAKCIYTESQYPRALRQVLQWASATGVGYMWPKCKAEDYGFGERRIIFEPLGLLDVLPVQVPKSNDVQDAYLVTIYEYMPIAEAHARFPLFQSHLQPVEQINFPSTMAARRADFAEKFRYRGENRNWGSLYCEIRYTFVRDMRINTTGYEIPMGDYGTSWAYTVPFVGQPIFGGIRNGQPFMREAKAEDCRVYPQLRLLISSPSIKQPMYDGPAFSWHGKIPVVQYTVDDWPWEPGACSLIDTVATVELTKRKHERQMDVVLTTKKNPPLGYNRGETQGPKIEQFDIFAQNVRMGMDGEPKKTLQSLLPDEVRVETIDIEWEEILQKMEEQQLGINDLGNLVNLKANLNSDAFDKAVESIGPIAKGIATSMEASNAKVAYMLKFEILQWMDARRIIEYIGPDNITPETLDFDPESLVPSHLEDEWNGPVLPFEIVAYDQNLNPVTRPKPSYYTKLQRAKGFAQKLRLINVPSTLLKITQLQQQTMVLGMFSRGFPIPPDYVAEQVNIKNWGTLPGDTLLQKWVNWEKLQLGLKAEAAHLAAQLGLGEPGQSAGKQHAGGRPPQNPSGRPVMKDKSTGGARPVIKTT